MKSGRLDGARFSASKKQRARHVAYALCRDFCPIVVRAPPRRMPRRETALFQKEREEDVCVQLADNVRITHPGKKWWREF